MSTNLQSGTGRKGPPLTREDVERLLQKAGSPIKLDLSEMNLRGIDLSAFNLVGAKLTFADLTGADLSGADLTGADLSGADLTGADLSRTILRRVAMVNTTLGKDIVAKGLVRGNPTVLIRVGNEVFSAPVSNYAEIQLYEKILNERGAIGVDEINWPRFDVVNETDLITISDDDAIILVEAKQYHPHNSTIRNSSIIPFRIVEEPLTSYNLATTLTALTELYTKYWLTAQFRYADLIEYTQTHDSRYAKEAGTTIAWATYNSPFNFGLQVDKLFPSAAEAFVTVIDGVTQRKARLQKLDLENQLAAQKIEETKQKAEVEYQAAIQKIKQDEQEAELKRKMAELELVRQKLEIDRQILELSQERIRVQEEIRTNSIELASKAANQFEPNAGIREVIIQSTLPNILQLQNATGLELGSPKSQDNEEE